MLINNVSRDIFLFKILIIFCARITIYFSLLCRNTIFTSQVERDTSYTCNLLKKVAFPFSSKTKLTCFILFLSIICWNYSPSTIGSDISQVCIISKNYVWVYLMTNNKFSFIKSYLIKNSWYQSERNHHANTEWIHNSYFFYLHRVIQLHGDKKAAFVLI